MFLRIFGLIMILDSIFPWAFNAANAETKTAHDFSFTSINGDHLPLTRFRGKAILLVNTASKCGFTPQYAKLQEIWTQYKSKGLIVLGVPSNDFGNQEPDPEAEIKKFCEVNFNISFPMTSRVHVKGNDAHPFYQWAANELGFISVPRWNFHKYLIATDGRLVDWFSTPTSPASEKVKKAIKKQLPIPEIK